MTEKKSVKKAAKAKASKLKTSKAKVSTAAKRPAKKPRVQKSGPAAHGNNAQVLDLHGKTVETITVDAMFRSEERVNTDVVYQAVLQYQAGEREGTAATKTRGEVRGGGKKPWKQKGTGQARHGSRRSPIWRGGGVTFGPHPRDYSYSIPSQIRRRAVAEVVKDKFAHGKLIILKDLEIKAPKTSEVAQILDVLKLKKPLFMVDKKTENFVRASRNIPGVTVKTMQEVNALDVAACGECVMTKAAYTGLLGRLKQ